jgi:hypothetical protein
VNSPSAYYRQHHGVEAPRIDNVAFQPYWRIRTRTRLDRLLADGSISLAAWRAGLRFRAAVDHLSGARRSHADRVEGGGRSGVGRLDAIEHLGRVKVALGPIATALVWSCVVDDASWSAVGAWLGIDPKTARRWTIVALQALALDEQRRL